MYRHVRVLARTGIAVATAGALALTTAPGATAADLSYSASTSVGVHNSYDKAKYTYFADALDSGAGMLELDVWTNVFGASWRVSHSNPIGNDNNCENAANASELRTKSRNRDLAGCLSDIKAWHDAHPGHRPIQLKIEMKDGFQANNGRGPAQLDALLTAKLGDALLRPPTSSAPTPTSTRPYAPTAGPPARPRGQVHGRADPRNRRGEQPLDSLWTDREYATHLRDLAAAGRLREAAAFPAVHNAATGDPRTRYTDPAIRPWFVIFDGDAATYVNGTIDTAWYDDRHYLVVMTDGQNVPPAIDATNPTQAQALDRVALLARQHASVVSADWYPLPAVLSTVVPRGTAG